jgi:hypothetical protein
MVSTLGKTFAFRSCLNAVHDPEAWVYSNPETARAAHASMFSAQRQLEVTSELGLCFPNTKTSNAMAFLNLQTVCLPARRALFMAGSLFKSKEKIYFRTAR